MSASITIKRVTFAVRIVITIGVFLTLTLIVYKLAHGVSRHSWFEMAPVHIKNISMAVEDYKSEKGSYPVSLAQMSTNSDFAFRSLVWGIISQTNEFLFEYQLGNDGFSISVRSAPGRLETEARITEHFSDANLK